MKKKSKADGYRIFNRYAPNTSSFKLDAFQMSAWWDNALGNVDLNDKVGSDQLRQRMAYALSQLLVVSKAVFPLNGRSEGLAYYYDILAENAFGNYETLLRHVLRSPAMGVFLSSAMNQKASLSKNTRPDENLAREFMQFLQSDLMNWKWMVGGKLTQMANPSLLTRRMILLRWQKC